MIITPHYNYIMVFIRELIKLCAVKVFIANGSDIGTSENTNRIQNERS